MSEHVVWHNSNVTRQRREKLNGHRGGVIWFTGLSCSGKSTLAHTLEELLFERNYHTYVFDGDNVRHGLCADLGFSEQDRKENIRRVGEMVKLFADAGIIAITAFIFPYRSDREKVREIIGDKDFIEIYCKCPLEICEGRDVKGLYQRARKGVIKKFTGISAPYEVPPIPHMIVDTGSVPIHDNARKIMQILIRSSCLNEN